MDEAGGTGSQQLGLPIAMYAVIGAGAGQDKVEEGQRVNVDLLDAEEGDEVTLTAKMVVDGDTVLATPDQLDGVTVTGQVVGVAKGPKINGFTYKQAHQPASSLRPPPALHRRRDHQDRHEVGGAAMSKTKGGGSTRNGRDSNAQRLGVKAFGGSR